MGKARLKAGRLLTGVLLAAASGCALLPGAGMPFPDPAPSRPVTVLAADLVMDPATDQLPAQAVLAPAPARVTVPDAPPLSQAAPPQPPRLPPLEPLVVTQLDTVASLPVLDEEILSLRLSEPLPVTELLRLLLRETAVSLVPDPGIDETFTGELKDVTLRQALNLVLAPHDLDYRVDDQVLRVFRRPLHTRVFELNFVAARRVTTRRVSTGHAAGVASRTELVSTDTRDVFAELEQAVEPLLSSTGRAHLDRGAALLRVTDLPERLDAVSAYLDRVVRRLGRQVRLEALIVEVVLDDPASAGLDWAELGRLAPTLRGIGGTSIRPVLPDRSEVERFLRALARQGVVTTISRSTAVTMNNEPVMIRTDSRRLPTGRLGEVATSPTTAGVVLSMTPQVGRDGVVTVSATPSVTTTVGSTSGDAVSTLTVRETDTLVRVRDGHTAVLSGWVHRGEPRALGGATPTAGEGVPVPAASAIELLILLTPTVIDGA